MEKEKEEAANAEDDGSLAEKATPRRADLTVESYLAYTGFPETGRRYIFSEIDTR